jgi:multimeric flavodoxin WrbA
MKKVIAFVGSGRKGYTYAATVQFLDNLQAMGDVETELVRLSDYHVGTCRGCCACMIRGEEFCPLKDDRDLLIGKIMASDGVVIATPNYSFQVSGLTKVFLDRLGFLMHRPRFFGKTCTSIVAQGVFGGNKLVDYLSFAAGALQMNVVKGSVILTRGPISPEQQQKNDRILAALGRRFYERLQGPALVPPPWLALFFFHMGRTLMRLETDDSSVDHRYYMEKGWFESDYFYPVALGPVKRTAGKMIDVFFERTAKPKAEAAHAPENTHGAA